MTTPSAAIPNAVSPETLSWAETRALIRSDLSRIVAHNEEHAGFARRVYYFLLPGMQALFWHRLARHAYLHGYRKVGRPAHSLTSGAAAAPTMMRGLGHMTSERSGTSVVTSAHGPTCTPSPMRTGPSTLAPKASTTSSPATG